MKKNFNPSEWLNKKGGSSEPPITVPECSNHTLEDEIEALTSAVESSCTDIAPDYTS
ncbi:MAG: hypothetical protein IK004_02090 [Bacteroidales bacterium]|nr:hypothetical protein [Bacteroidales bacterium]